MKYPANRRAERGPSGRTRQEDGVSAAEMRMSFPIAASLPANERSPSRSREGSPIFASRTRHVRALVGRFAVPALVALAGHAAVLYWPAGQPSDGSAGRHAVAVVATTVNALEVTLTEPLGPAPGSTAARESGPRDGLEHEPADEAVVMEPNVNLSQLETELSTHVEQQLHAFRRTGAGAGLLTGEAALRTGHGVDGLGAASWTARGRGGAGGGLVQPLVAPLPPYPPAARLQGRTGAVELAVSIDDRGRATSVEIARSSGHDDFDEAARSTIRQHWRFPAPANRAAEPLLVLVRFDLNRN